LITQSDFMFDIASMGTYLFVFFILLGAMMLLTINARLIIFSLRNESIIEISKHGIFDKRIMRKPIPWHVIDSVEVFKATLSEKLEITLVRDSNLVEYLEKKQKGDGRVALPLFGISYDKYDLYNLKARYSK